MIKSPHWYLKKSVLQEGVAQNEYEESMISYFSQVTNIKAARNVRFTILASRFDEPTRTISVDYESSRKLYKGEKMTVTISNF